MAVMDCMVGFSFKKCLNWCHVPQAHMMSDLESCEYKEERVLFFLCFFLAKR